MLMRLLRTALAGPGPAALGPDAVVGLDAALGPEGAPGSAGGPCAMRPAAGPDAWWLWLSTMPAAPARRSRP